MSDLRRFVALSCLAIAACGGGGSSGGSDDLSIGALSPGSVNTTFFNELGGPARSVTLSASYGGTTSGPLNVVVTDPDAVFSSASMVVGTSTVSLQLFVKDTAANGRYNQSMVLHVCRDAACASEVQGFPRTIQKDVTIQDITANATSLSFTSSAGIASPTQALAITAPAGADFEYDPVQFPYVTYTEPDGTQSSTAQNIGSVFSITKTTSGFDVHANPASIGRYVGKMYVGTPGYRPVVIDLDYQVGAATTPVATLLTTSVSGSGPASSSADIPAYVDVLLDMGQSVEVGTAVVATDGSSNALSTSWLRYYDRSFFTSGTGPTDNANRLRFFLNPCLFGVNCLPAGTYTANIVITANAFGATSTFNVPVTFEITP